MQAQKIKVSAVSYLNTLPFLYGINNSDVKNELDLLLDIPSDCAQKLLSGEVDLGLVPIAIIPELKEHYIISDYCIGAEGKVNSVLLLSDVPLHEIEAVQLDYQSRTSVNLVQILAREFWNITPQWLNTNKGFEENISEKTAGVIIGDRIFSLKKQYKYQYDLAEEWEKFTGLPFVFACWVANKKLDGSFIQNFNSALQFGIENIDKVVTDSHNSTISKEKLQDYLCNDISYVLDEKKQIAITKFINFLKTREVISSDI
jgi:chorismate dehydratase